MIYLIAFAAFVAVALFWRTFARVARALSLAVLGGIAIGSAAGGVEVGVLAGAALLVLILTMTRAPRLTASALPAMSAVRSADEAPTVASDPVDVRAARDENRATWFGFARRSRPAPRDDAWTLWTRAAPESAARIAVARRSCERLAERLRARPMDPNALDRLVLIDRTVPALIESDLEEAEKAAGVGERQLILTGLAEAIEEFAADCERQTAGEVSEAGIRSVVLRRRLRSGFAQDGF